MMGFPGHERPPLFFVRMAFLVLVGLVLGACAKNPATGRRQLDVLSPQREIALGRKAAPKFTAAHGGEIPAPTLRAYVREVGAPMAAESERPGLPWSFQALDAATVNAFALPGGKVFITRGLLKRLEDEAQLAAVLGHEIGHVTAEHVDQRLGQSMIAQTGLELLGAAASRNDAAWLQALGIGAQYGSNLYLLKFNREQELEADQLGMRYMRETGHDPRALAEVMRILGEAGGDGGSLEIFATHPHPETRIRKAREALRRAPGTLEGARKAERYRTRVLKTLRALPPPEHDGQDEAN
jgi:predicted Zn-dependent protease